jgi:hypothetical protein
MAQSVGQKKVIAMMELAPQMKSPRARPNMRFETMSRNLPSFS